MKPTNEQIRRVFQLTADATGGDILQCCMDVGEEPVVPREVLLDYLTMYGGKDAKLVQKWIRSLKWKEIETELDKAGVPREWV